MHIWRATSGRNVNVTIGRVACEAWSVTWNLGTNSAFALGLKPEFHPINNISKLISYLTENTASPLHKMKLLVMFREIAIYSKNLMERINPSCEQRSDY
jgi:hypothetical protein